MFTGAAHGQAQPHPYHLAHARKILADADGDARNADRLARWATFATGQNPAPHGVLVARDGSLVAETTYQRSPAGAVYVNAEAIRTYRLDRHELKGALVAIATQIRQHVIQVPLSRFSGPSPDRI